MATPSLPRQDHYEIARERALGKLRHRFDPARLQQLGAEVRQDGTVRLPCLCWQLELKIEPLSAVLLPDRRQCEMAWQILALEYLGGEPAAAPVRFVSLADFPEARGYLKAFQGRVTGRLARAVGADERRFSLACERCAFARGDGRPLSYLFRFFPNFELQVVRHEGDEDLPPDCNVLFANNAPRVLSLESMIVAAEKLVSCLMGRTPSARGEPQ